MTKDDVIRLAREAGFTLLGNHAWDGFDATIERFAARVMEEDAKVCEARNTGDCSREDQESTLCAAAIRARKP